MDGRILERNLPFHIGDDWMTKFGKWKRMGKRVWHKCILIQHHSLHFILSRLKLKLFFTPSCFRQLIIWCLTLVARNASLRMNRSNSGPISLNIWWA
jgi:hypothetical protein